MWPHSVEVRPSTLLYEDSAFGHILFKVGLSASFYGGSTSFARGLGLRPHLYLHCFPGLQGTYELPFGEIRIKAVQ